MCGENECVREEGGRQIYTEGEGVGHMKGGRVCGRAKERARASES